MDSRESTVRKIFLIYCLERLNDGSYIPLNRNYKPLGVFGREWVEYESHPSRFKFKRTLSAQQVAALSCKGDTDPQRIYLYLDGSAPTGSAANWRAYSERLERLAGLKIEQV